MKKLFAKPNVSITKNIQIMYIFAIFLNLNAYIPIYIHYLNDIRGLSLTTIALLEGIGWIITALGELPTGMVSDRFGRKISLIIGCLILGPVYIAYGLVGYFPLILTFHLIWNFSYGFFSGSDSALLYDSLKSTNSEHQFNKTIGNYLAIGATSTAIGVLIGGWISVFSISLPFVIGGSLVFLMAFILFFIKEPTEFNKGNADNKSMIRNTKIAFSIVSNNKVLKNLIISRAIFHIPPWCYTFFFVTNYFDEKQINIFWLGYMFFGIRLVSILGSYFSSKIAKRFSNISMLYGIPIVISILILLTTIIPIGSGITTIIFISLIWSIGVPFYSNEINKNTPSAQRATILSFQSFLTTCGLAIMIPVFGYLLDHFGYNFVTVIIGLLTLLYIYYASKKYKGATNEVALPLVTL